MMVLVTGGAASGKSAYAENLLLRLAGDRPRLYLATMSPAGDEAAARIARHRAQRAGRGFVTVERGTNLAGLAVPVGCALLLEDLGNLCANELFDPAGSGPGAEEAVMGGIEHLRTQCGPLVIVTNEVFSGGIAYQGDTDRFLRLLARLNRRIAAKSDAVCEVVCGIPVYYKGAEPDVGT